MVSVAFAMDFEKRCIRDGFWNTLSLGIKVSLWTFEKWSLNIRQLKIFALNNKNRSILNLDLNQKVAPNFLKSRLRQLRIFALNNKKFSNLKWSGIGRFVKN